MGGSSEPAEPPLGTGPTLSIVDCYYIYMSLKLTTCLFISTLAELHTYSAFSILYLVTISTLPDNHKHKLPMQCMLIV